VDPGAGKVVASLDLGALDLPLERRFSPFSMLAAHPAPLATGRFVRAPIMAAIKDRYGAKMGVGTHDWFGVPSSWLYNDLFGFNFETKTRFEPAMSGRPCCW
jgi:hypothetical protein